MELYQIRYFLAVADTLNFTRASERSFVSQPALTKAIQCLWDEDARRQWFTEAWEDLKAQVQDKLRRDKEKEDKDEGEGD